MSSPIFFAFCCVHLYGTCSVPKERREIVQVLPHAQSETPVVTDKVHTISSAKIVRELSTATTSGYDTPSTILHVGEFSPFPVGTLVSWIIPLVSEHASAIEPSIQQFW